MTRSEATYERLDARGLAESVVLIALRHGCTFDDIAGRGRSKRIALARHNVWRWLRQRGYSYPEIAWLWAVDHSTVQHGVKRLGSLDNCGPVGLSACRGVGLESCA